MTDQATDPNAAEAKRVQAEDTVAIAATIVAAYVSHNSVPAGELTKLIASVYGELDGLICGKSSAVSPAIALEPAVPVTKSVTYDYIVCLEDGKKFKSLKRHLNTVYGLTPDAYRAKWGLPRDYPMVASSYAAVRSSLAKKIGLGTPGISRPQLAAVS